MNPNPVPPTGPDAIERLAALLLAVAEAEATSDSRS
jgi:hypothetical protein